MYFLFHLRFASAILISPFPPPHISSQEETSIYIIHGEQDSCIASLLIRVVHRKHRSDPVLRLPNARPAASKYMYIDRVHFLKNERSSPPIIPIDSKLDRLGKLFYRDANARVCV